MEMHLKYSTVFNLSADLSSLSKLSYFIFFSDGGNFDAGGGGGGGGGGPENPCGFKAFNSCASC